MICQNTELEDNYQKSKKECFNVVNNTTFAISNIPFSSTHCCKEFFYDNLLLLMKMESMKLMK